MNDQMTWNIHSQEQLHACAASLFNFAAGEKIFLIAGPMGAGKTTFIKEMCESLGTHDHLSSPSFSIVNEYSYSEGKIFHFDLYRIKDPAELLDLGVEEYLDSGEYCFIEWPSMIIPHIEGTYLEINISVIGEDRTIHAAKKKSGK